MKNLLISGIAASALIVAAGGAVASDSFKGDTASAAKTMGLEANGRKGGGGVKPGWGGGHKPGIGHGPKPGGNWGGGVKPGPKPGGHWGGGNKPGWTGNKPGGWNGGGHRWGHKVSGKWHGGWKAPGGWNGYHKPYRGYRLSSYWIQPSFSIGNYWLYGLNQPSNGYHWSRYYDDAVLRDGNGYVTDYRSGIDWNSYEGGYESDEGYYDQPAYAPAIAPDNGAYDWGDSGDVGFAAPDGNRYRYEGDWVEGEFVDDEKRVWDGTWDGQVIREGGTSGPYAEPGAPYKPAQAYAPPQAYHVPPGYGGYEKCLKSNGLTGAAIGAVIGGVAGNQIAGRGDKLGGTLAGAGLGGLAGLAIEKATSKCKKYVPGYREDVSYAPPQQYYPQPQPAPQYYPPTYQSGYYYYAPPVTTVTVVPGQVVTSTHTTTEYVTEYVNVPAPKKRIVAKKRYVKPKPKCYCR